MLKWTHRIKNANLRFHHLPLRMMPVFTEKKIRDCHCWTKSGKHQLKWEKNIISCIDRCWNPSQMMNADSVRINIHQRSMFIFREWYCPWWKKYWKKHQIDVQNSHVLCGFLIHNVHLVLLGSCLFHMTTIKSPLVTSLLHKWLRGLLLTSWTSLQFRCMVIYKRG